MSRRRSSLPSSDTSLQSKSEKANNPCRPQIRARLSNSLQYSIGLPVVIEGKKMNARKLLHLAIFSSKCQEQLFDLN